jgi:hypothetical protein
MCGKRITGLVREETTIWLRFILKVPPWKNEKRKVVIISRKHIKTIRLKNIHMCKLKGPFT